MLLSTSGLILLAAIILINLPIGILAILRNPRSIVNRWFLVMTIGVTLWAAASTLSDSSGSYEVARYASFVAFGGSFFGLVSAYIFSRAFINKRLTPRDYLVFAGGILLSFVFATPLVYNLDTFTTYELGPLYIPYLVSMLAVLGFTAANFIKAMRRNVQPQRSQARYIIAGFVGMVFCALITNAIIPAIIPTTTITKLGPAFSILFVAAGAYAIIKHRLFDIRLIVAKSFAYLLLVAALTAIYVSIVFGLATTLTEENSTFANKVVPILTALFIAGTAPALRKVFDKITNSIFYRDAYDPQTFLDELNKTLVGNIEIGILLRHTCHVIEDNLKADCHIYVRQTETAGERLIGNTRMDIKPKHLELIKNELSTIKEKVVVTDELGQHYLELKNALYINEIAVISSLITNYSASHEATAYLMLGPKKSGNAYSKQDIRIINIITDELLIATQNALRFEEIQSFNITLQNRINDATSKLKRSNEKLKEMDETKDEFISMASHQLRTPLTSVKGYLSMVLDGDAGDVPEQQQQLLKQAYLSSQRMVYLIADLLNVSRLKTGKFVIDTTPTNLAEIVESEIEQLTEAARSKKISLNYSKPEDFPIINLDETKTRQVIMNFIDNAIYYTPSGGRIKVELRTDRSSIYFMVKDNGMGVPKSDQPHLFTKFYRAKNAQKARPDGTGLGLFMAKKVITEQGGTILFESNEDKGSTFGFKFELPDENRQRDEEKDDDKESKDSEEN